MVELTLPRSSDRLTGNLRQGVTARTLNLVRDVQKAIGHRGRVSVEPFLFLAEFRQP